MKIFAIGELEKIHFPLVKWIKKKKWNPDTEQAEYYHFAQIEASFDIETTNYEAFTPDTRRKAIYAMMYHWQFMIGDTNGIIITGRKWEEFDLLLERLRERYSLNPHRKLVIYVHNLAYEFAFLMRRYKWNRVFATEKWEPLTAELDGIEFRCSYRMSGASLETVGNKMLLKHDVRKMSGDLDYTKIRGPETNLTTDELQYCYNDVAVVNAFLAEKYEDENPAEIPLTNTGFIRRDAREHVLKSKHSARIIQEIQVQLNEYKALKDAFTGGLVHASPRYAFRMVNNVFSFDKSSSYPSAICYGYFPMSNCEFIRNPELLDIENLGKRINGNELFCGHFLMEFENLRTRTDNDAIISASKCKIDGERTLWNGRVARADKLLIRGTELDYKNYKLWYKWDGEVKFYNLYRYHAGRLPKCFIDVVLKWYKFKTTLKGVKGSEALYMRAKNMLNSLYGMMVSAIVHDEFFIEEIERIWDVNIADIGGDKEEKQRFLDELERYNTSKKRFLCYQWGIWVTAWARYNLLQLVLKAGENHVYMDTDCDKILWYENLFNDVDELNRKITQDGHNLMQAYGYTLDDIAPKDPAGNRHFLGLFEHEKTYERFKTLGAKRYLYQCADDTPDPEEAGKIGMVVSGLGKNALSYLRGKYPDTEELFKRFNQYMEIPPEHTGRMIYEYHEQEYTHELVDCDGNPFTAHEFSGVGMRPGDFHFSRSISELITFCNRLREINMHTEH